LKPLKGLEENLEANLDTFFHLRYPSYEILFSVASANDPALPLVRRLMLKYPQVSARLFIGDVKAGPNPKVNNIIDSFERAENDWVLISDSNTRLDYDYLERLALQFEDDVGVLTSVVRGCEPSGLGGWLENIFLNTFYARWMCLAFYFKNPIVLGKSMLLRKSSAQRFGGVKTLARYIAEDFMAGEAMQKLGLRVELLQVPVSQPLGRYSFTQFWQRHLRWGRIRKNQARPLFCIEPFLSSPISGALGAWVLSYFFDQPWLLFFSLHLLIWFMSDMMIRHRLKEPLFWDELPEQMGLWLMREFLSLPLWLHIAVGNTVNWRGQKLKVQAGGLLLIEPKLSE
jgi:ceramide glucosyltransferase